MRKTLLAMVAVLALSLTACGNGGPGRVNGSTKYIEVENNNRDKIPCILYDADGGGGSITCDWSTK